MTADSDTESDGMGTSHAGREAFWGDVVARYERRLKAYARRTRCEADQVEEMVQDTWALAVEHEADLRHSAQPWDDLHRLVGLRPRS